MSESTAVNEAVERIPLDNNFIGSCAPTDDVKVRNGDLELFVVSTGSDVELLNCALVDMLSIVESLLNSSEYVVRTADNACKTFVCGVNKKLVNAFFISGRSGVNYVNNNLCGKTTCGDCKYVVVRI